MPAARLPNEIKPDDTVRHAPTLTISHRVPWSVLPLAGTTVGLMAVSLTHLSDGVTQLTAITSWQAWAMAIGIDSMLISVALTQLTSPPDVKKDIAIRGDFAFTTDHLRIAISLLADTLNSAATLSMAGVSDFFGLL
jgi:hypothetical protein